MPEPRLFKYFAFISYSRRDEAFAHRLQRFLTGFKLPTRLCKQYPDKPTALRPVYRDKTNLGLDNLGAGLTRGLAASRFLIVICSPNSAKPNREGKNWIDTEVRTFVELDERNKDYVIPILLREKNGPSTKECTPAAVQELHLLASDVSDKGERRVFADVAAKMLALEPDELWDWWSREQRRKARILRSLGGLAAAAAAFAGYWSWDYYTPHYSYFADYAEFNNIPRGIRPLTEEETRHMESHYRFTTQHHRLKRIDNLNAEGIPISTAYYPGRAGRPVSISLDYSTENGRVSQQVFYDARGKVIQIRATGHNAITFHTAEQEDGLVENAGVTGASFSRDFRLREENQRLKGIERINVTRDEQGAVVTEQYRNAYNYPVRNTDGAWGCRYQRDEFGRPTCITYLDEKGKPLPDQKGVAWCRYEYDRDSGQVASVSYFRKDGTPTLGYDNAAAREIYEWENGNLTKHLHSYHEMLSGISPGIAVTVYERDEKGHCTGISYLGGNGEPVLHQDGYARVRYTYDGNGRQTGEAFFGLYGEPCPCGGYASTRYTYDEHGNLVDKAYFDLGGKTVSAEHRNYDDCGNVTELVYLDGNGRLCPCEDGYARVRLSYDGRGAVAGGSYFDGNGNPCLHKYGYASFRNTTDDHGNVTRVDYFGVDGKPCLHCEGYASVTLDYDERGNLKMVTSRDSDGNPCLRKPAFARVGYASVRYAYDNSGNLVEKEYQDANGKPCLCDEGYAGARFTYDDRGNLTGRNYFGVDGKPCPCTDGYAAARFTYDGSGNRTEEAYFGADEKPCIHTIGAAGVRISYDALGSKTRITTFGTDGNPCNSRLGYASEHLTYDGAGRPVEMAYYDSRGNLCKHKAGYARRVMEYGKHTCKPCRVKAYDETGTLLWSRDIADR